MRSSLIRTCLLIISVAVVGKTSRAIATNPDVDFGSFVAEQLSGHSEQLFGFRLPFARVDPSVDRKRKFLRLNVRVWRNQYEAMFAKERVREVRDRLK